MNRTFRLLLVFVGLIGMTTPLAAAIVLVESLEWVSADADLVVRGTITEFDRVNDKGTIWAKATVKVAAGYKGKVKEGDEIKFVASHKSRFASDALAALGKNKTEAIFCLVKSERYKDKGADYKDAPWALRLSQGDLDQSAIDLSGESGTLVVTADARLLTRKDDIVKAAEAAASPEAAKPKQGRLDAPASSDVVRKYSTGDGVWLIVPLNDRLQAIARDWLKSKEIDFRVEGANALKHFKSDDNIQLLKRLLEDPGSRSSGKAKTYPVRQAAFAVLKEWGVQVKPPVVEE